MPLLPIATGNAVVDACVTIPAMSSYQNNWNIIGHTWAVDHLEARLRAGKIKHAYLFIGPSQAGKLTLARRFAQAMNCLQAGGEPCGECRACALIERGLHPDVHMIEPEGRSIKIEVVRDLQQMLILRPIEARYRVAILRDFQQATPHAVDSLLKTLEEPPATARLLLTVDSPVTLAPTIVSRCQVMSLRHVASGEIASRLSQLYGVAPEDAEQYARLSGGCPGWAINALQKPEMLERRDDILSSLLGLLHADRRERFDFGEELARSDDLLLVLELWERWWHDVLLLVEGVDVPLLNADYYEDLAALAAQVTSGEARTVLRTVSQTIDAINKNANTRLALEVMLLCVPYLTRVD